MQGALPVAENVPGAHGAIEVGKNVGEPTAGEGIKLGIADGGDETVAVQTVAPTTRDPIQGKQEENPDVGV